MPKIINLFIRVVDNLGDIGFGADLIRSFAEEYSGAYFFDIWTDEVKKVESFFEKNRELKEYYEIRNMKEIEHKRTNISFLLFHHSIPANYPYEKQELFLRIDYLSFDVEWVKHHGMEHIDSKEHKKIIEIIPSPLDSGGGLITPTKHLMTRNALAKKYGLDATKKWITIFAYTETLKNQLSLDLSGDTEILILGGSSEGIKGISNLHVLPFLSQREFSSIIHESAWAIIRGEVSFILTLQLGTPFLWDMYKEIGGFHAEQAKQFLEWKGSDMLYRDMFYALNGQAKSRLSLREIDDFFRDQAKQIIIESKNLREELEKYIDKYHFSL